MTLYRHNAKGRIEKIPRVELAVFWLVMALPWVGLGYEVVVNLDENRQARVVNSVPGNTEAILDKYLPTSKFALSVEDRSSSTTLRGLGVKDGALASPSQPNKMNKAGGNRAIHLMPMPTGSDLKAHARQRPSKSQGDGSTPSGITNLAATPMSSSTEGRALNIENHQESASAARNSLLLKAGKPLGANLSRNQARPAQPFNFGTGSKYDRHNEQLKQAGN